MRKRVLQLQREYMIWLIRRNFEWLLIRISSSNQFIQRKKN